MVIYEKDVKDLGFHRIFVRREGGAMKNDLGEGKGRKLGAGGIERKII